MSFVSASERFPDEIFELIFSVLDVPTLVRYKTLSRRFYEIIENSSSLQYRIELLRDGLEDYPSNHTSAQKLQKLVDRRQSWATMRPIKRIRGHMPKFFFWHFSGGLFVSVLGDDVDMVDVVHHGDEDDEDEDEDGADDEDMDVDVGDYEGEADHEVEGMDDDDDHEEEEEEEGGGEGEIDLGEPLLRLADSVEGLRIDEDSLDYAAKIQVLQLPNTHTGEGMKLRFIYEMDFYPNEVALDSSQDLLVLMKWIREMGGFRVTLYTRTLSENTVHPDSQRPQIGPFNAHPLTDGSVDLHIAGDKLAMCESYELKIWNWKTGSLLTTIDVMGAGRSFGFLSPDYFTVTLGWATGEPLRLYSLGPWPNTDTGETCVLLANLFLPSLDRDEEMVRITDNISGPLNSPVPGRMFGPSDDSLRVLVFDSGAGLGGFTEVAFGADEDQGVEASTLMVVKNRRLIHIGDSIMRARSIQDIRLGPSVYRCANWAARACTFLKAVSPSLRKRDIWTRCVEGSRALLTTLVATQPPALYVSDFGLQFEGIIGEADEGSDALEPPRPLSFIAHATDPFVNVPSRPLPFKDRRIPFSEGGGLDVLRSLIHQDCLIRIKEQDSMCVVEILVFG